MVKIKMSGNDVLHKILLSTAVTPYIFIRWRNLKCLFLSLFTILHTYYVNVTFLPFKTNSGFTNKYGSRSVYVFRGKKIVAPQNQLDMLY